MPAHGIANKATKPENWDLQKWAQNTPQHMAGCSWSCDLHFAFSMTNSDRVAGILSIVNRWSVPYSFWFESTFPLGADSRAGYRPVVKAAHSRVPLWRRQWWRLAKKVKYLRFIKS